MWAKFTLDTLIVTWGKNFKYSNTYNDGTFTPSGLYVPPDREWFDDFGIICNATAIQSEYGINLTDSLAYTSQDMFCITQKKYELGWHIKDTKTNDIDIVYKVEDKTSYSLEDQTSFLIYLIKRVGRLDDGDN